MINANKMTRPAAVSGMFYASDPQQLSSDIHAYLSQANNRFNCQPKALIAPHAGYIYSASIAANAYKLLEPIAQEIHQVILLGPSHRVAFKGIATPDVNFFETPLGSIKINNQFCDMAEQLNFVNKNRLAHKDEHSLEVHLPFLQSLLTDFELTPFVVGDCDEKDVEALLELFWTTKNRLYVISTDLSHFQDYDSAIKHDANTSHAIESMQPEKIHYDDACGRNPLNGMLNLAKHHQLKIKCLNLKNSGDTAGDKNRVVGYGSYAAY